MSAADPIKTEAIRRCPMCGGGGRRLYEGLRDHAHGVNGRWQIDQCASCWGLWLNPQPIRDERHRCYPNEYFTHGTRETEIQEQALRLPLWLRVERAIQRRIELGFAASRFGYRQIEIGAFWRLCASIITALLPPVRNNAAASVMFVRRGKGKLVDIGCGDGRFTAWMKALGWDVTGIEPDGLAARRAERLGVPTICETLEAADVLPAAYNVALMGHVIEHIDRPADALRKIHSMLKPGGYLVITTPNVESLGHRAFKRFWRHLDTPRHLLLFSMSSLCNLARTVGFEITFRCTVTRMAWWTAAQSMSANGNALLPSVETQAHTWSSRIFAMIETAGAMIVPTVGEELLVVARKPAA